MNRYAPKKTVKTGGLAIPGYGFGGGGTPTVDYLEVAWEETDSGGLTITKKECARIMGIVRLSKKINLQFLKNNGLVKDDKRIREYESIVLLIAWLQDVSINRKTDKLRLNLNSSVRIQYKQYNFDKIEIDRGRRLRKMWLDIIPLHSIVQPVCGYHDPDLLPAYDSEAYLSQQTRFNIVSLSMTRKCVQTYRSLLGNGECIYDIDSIGDESENRKARERGKSTVGFKRKNSNT